MMNCTAVLASGIDEFRYEWCDVINHSSVNPTICPEKGFRSVAHRNLYHAVENLLGFFVHPLARVCST